jgi:hypothetical protein
LGACRPQIFWEINYVQKNFGQQNVEPTPDLVRESIERELGEFFYLFNLILGYSAMASDQSHLYVDATFKKIEPLADLAKASVDKLQQLWPTGTSAISHLRKIAIILPDWFSNFRAWQNLVNDFEDGTIDDINKDKYQRFVLKNREYSSQLDESLINAKTQLEKYGIDFDVIYDKSNERAISYLASH